MDFVKTGLLVYGVLIFIVHGSCDSRGHGGVSNNINESKRRNVFVAEYEANPNPYIVNDSLKLKVIGAWVEHKWAYGDNYNESIIIDDQYQLVIETEPDNLSNYGLTWRIGTDGNRYIRSCGTTCLMSDFNQLPSEIEEWNVQSGWKLDSLSKKTIIGTFRIERK